MCAYGIHIISPPPRPLPRLSPSHSNTLLSISLIGQTAREVAAAKTAAANEAAARKAAAKARIHPSRLLLACAHWHTVLSPAIEHGSNQAAPPAPHHLPLNPHAKPGRLRSALPFRLTPHLAPPRPPLPFPASPFSAQSLATCTRARHQCWHPP